MRYSRRSLHILLVALTAVFSCAMSFCIIKGARASQPYQNTEYNKIYVRLVYENKAWEFRYPDIIYSGGLDGEMGRDFEKDYRGRITRQVSPVKCAYALQDAEKKLVEIAKSIDRKPKNAEVLFSPDSSDKFEIKDDIKGRKVNVSALSGEISGMLSAGDSAEITVAPEIVDAPVTAAKLRESFAVRQEFRTDFSASPPERKHNIGLSLSKFNGMIIPPGASASFNRTVGPRTEERGYKTAKIIVGGDFIEGLGGGVCQTSTTLYNALLLSDITITEYHSHTLAVSYVLPSFDAMVNISTADLKFRNDTDNFIYIKAWTENDKACVRIYGKKMDYRISRKSTVLKTYETPREKVVLDTEGKYKNIFSGDRAIVIRSKPKTESTGELQYYRGGVLYKTVNLRKDMYSQLIGTEVIGTAKRPE